MKRLILFTAAILLFCSCGGKAAQSGNENSTSLKTENVNDEGEIRDLIRQALKWGVNSSIDLTPAIANSENNFYIGFDPKIHKQNLARFKECNFFSREFIDNYDRIITTLNEKLKSGEIQWPVGELKPFAFSCDYDVWCACQDVPYDKPDPIENIEIDVLQLDSAKGELYWKWGLLDKLNTDEGWKNIRNKFNVIKEDNKWKISYLETFDYENGIKVWSEAQTAEMTEE